MYYLNSYIKEGKKFIILYWTILRNLYRLIKLDPVLSWLIKLDPVLRLYLFKTEFSVISNFTI